jgi:hypothetical protein
MPRPRRSLKDVQRIGEKLYRPVVLMVRTRNGDGTPGLLEYVRDDDIANLTGSDIESDFFVAFLPLKELEAK